MSAAHHECIQHECIQQMKIELAVAQSDIKAVKDDIKGIKENMSKFTWMLIGSLGTTILTLIGIIVTIVISLKK